MLRKIATACVLFGALVAGMGNVASSNARFEDGKTGKIIIKVVFPDEPVPLRQDKPTVKTPKATKPSPSTPQPSKKEKVEVSPRPTEEEKPQPESSTKPDDSSEAKVTPSPTPSENVIESPAPSVTPTKIEGNDDNGVEGS